MLRLHFADTKEKGTGLRARDGETRERENRVSAETDSAKEGTQRNLGSY